jgi:hypothetical protein
MNDEILGQVATKDMIRIVPAHMWGDETFDWASLEAAISLIHDACYNWGRLGVSSKEKWGCADIYVEFWNGSIHSLLYPGYIFNYFPSFLMWLNSEKITSFNNRIGLVNLVHKYQGLIYRRAYEKALKKYPHIAKEILCNADYPELIPTKYEDL